MFDAVNPWKSGFQGKIAEIRGQAVDTRLRPKVPSETMIRLTERAAAKLKAMQEELGDDSKFLRLFVESGGCSGYKYGMSFDVPRDNDVRLDDAGVGMVLDPESYEQLKEVRVDFDDGLHGKGFEIINPQAQSTCGCGKSFN